MEMLLETGLEILVIFAISGFALGAGVATCVCSYTLIMRAFERVTGRKP